MDDKTTPSSFSSPGHQGAMTGVKLNNNDDDPDRVLEMGKESPKASGSNKVQSPNAINKSEESQITASTSNISTLEPFYVNGNVYPKYNPQRPRKARFRPHPTLIHFDYLFGSESWSRFLILKTSEEISATKLENMLLTKSPSRDMSLRKLDENNWLIEATNRNQSETYQDLKSLGNIQIVVKRHDKLNSIYGTVVLPTYEGNIDQIMLLDSLKKRYPNVEDLEIYEIPQRNKENSPLKIAKIKFEGQSLPSDVKIMGQKRELRPHIPKPMQCKKCSKFGHSTTKCRNEQICAFCGSSEHKTKWKCGEMKCINCGQNHHARSKECKFYIYNTELKLLMERSGMKVKEAKLELKVRGIKDPARVPQYNTIARQNAQQKMEIVNNQGTSIDHTNSQGSSVRPKEINKGIKLTNPFDSLNTNSELEIEKDNEMNIELSSKGIKRTRESNTPPKINDEEICSKSLKSVKDFEKMLKKNPSLLNHNDETIITPSPVFQSAMQFNKCQPQDREQTNDNQTKCPMKIPHENNCGCHQCFMKEFGKIRPPNKISIVNMIRNFLSNKVNISITELDSHQSGCLCVDHLNYYREHKIKIIDKLLTNQLLETSSSLLEHNESPEPKKKINIVRTNSDIS